MTHTDRPTAGPQGSCPHDSALKVTEVLLNSIKVNGRHRKDFGDIALLAESIKQLGLLQPIGITLDNELIYGHRRLLAFKQLGRETIPARVLDVPAIVLAEHAENEIRKDFTHSERVAIGQAVEAELGKRQGQRTDLASEQHGELVQNFAQVESGKKTRQIAAEKAGFGNPETYRQAKVVVTHGTPELVEAMDQSTIAISTAAKLATAPVDLQRQAVADPKKAVDLANQASAAKVREMKHGVKETAQAQMEAKRAEVKAHLEAVAANSPGVLSGVYDVIVIDPPWEMEKIERYVTPSHVALDYPTMSIDDIKKMEIPCADNCHVWLWTTHKYLPEAFGILKHWGLQYVCTFVWHKPGGFQPPGRPQYNAEFVLYARRGSPVFMDTKAFPVAFQAPRGAHSEKPEEFYDLVRRVTAGRRLDMFNRRKILGFDTWGKEAAGLPLIESKWAAAAAGIGRE